MFFEQAGYAGVNWGQSALTSLMGGRLVPARVTHLEMTASRAFFEKVDAGLSQKNATKQKTRAVDKVNSSRASEIAQPVGAQSHIARLKNCPTHFYLYLYDRIGRAHHWGQRLKIPEENLEYLLRSPKTIIHLLSLDGCPAGFCEMSLKYWPAVEIVYFGLMAEFQGQGWGRFFLDKMIEHGWSLEPERLIIQTNTLDSPKALKLYQELGFHPTRVRDVMMEYVPQRAGQTMLGRK